MINNTVILPSEEIIWKPIIINGIVTNYEVNNIGQIRSVIKFKTHRRCNILKPYISNKYSKLVIYINGKPYTRTVHRLVAEAFISNNDPLNKTDINHIDGNKHNNCVWNLEWCTKFENMQHAFINGLVTIHYGEDHLHHKYDENQVRYVCKMLKEHVPLKLIKYLLNIDYNSIINIKIGHSWKHISSQYNINYKEKYKKYKKIKYSKLKQILLELEIFKQINLEDLLYSKYITYKRKLIKDLENRGYEIFIDKELENEFKQDYEDE